MGIEDKQIQAIIDAHTETTDGLKAQRDQYKEQADKVPDLLKQLEEAKADTGLADMQAKYEQAQADTKAAQAERDRIQSEYDEYKSGVEAREAEQAKAGAYRKQVLEAAQIASTYIDDVMGVTKLDAIELDEDGNVKDADKLIESAKDKWKSFVVKTKTDPAGVDNPPTSTAGKGSVEGAHERAIQIAKERHERMYGKSEE